MKNILLVSTETDLELLIALSNKLKPLGFHIDLLVADRWNLFVRNDHVRSRLKENLINCDLIDEFETMYDQMTILRDNVESMIVDWEYLESFEKQHNDGFTLNRVLRSDFAVSNDFHDCTLYPSPQSRELKFKFLELNLKLLSGILKKKNYTLIFSVSTQTIVKPILYKLATKRGIPYLTFEMNRISDRWQIYENFCIGPDSAIKLEMQKILDSCETCSDAEIFIDTFIASARPLYAGHNRAIDLSYSCQGFVYLLSKIWWTLKHHTILILRNRINKRKDRFNLYMPTMYTSIRFYLKYYVNIFRYNKNPLLNECTLPERQYIYIFHYI